MHAVAADLGDALGARDQADDEGRGAAASAPPAASMPGTSGTLAVL